MDIPESLRRHRMRSDAVGSVIDGNVRYAPIKSAWFLGMSLGALIGGALTFTWPAFIVFLGTTGLVLLFGHSLGSHRKLIHQSFQCPGWLEYTLVYCGVQVGLAGPLGLLRQHELRDYAQRLSDCHDYLRHGSSFWRDAWWQLNCELYLDHPPQLTIEARIDNDPFYRFLERTWMAQQIPPALLLYAVGGWGFVFWGVCARVTAGVFGHWLIGYFAHNHGGMHYEVRRAAVQGRNIPFTSLLTMGESWHNNHHAFPGSARLGLFAGEWDPGWWALAVLRRLGLVWEIRLPAQLPHRPELQPFDAPAHSQLAIRSRADGAPPSTCPDLRQVASLCAKSWLGTGEPAYAMQGPAANLPARAIRRIAGRRVHFRENAAASRLELQSFDQTVRGLPALCVAVSTRGWLFAALALCLAPFAVAFETLREFCDAA